MANSEETSLSILWRGQVLHEICLLEMQLNGYLAQYFCGDDTDKSLDLILLILGDERMNLGAKAQVFYGIAPEKHKTWYNSYKSARIPDKGKKPYAMNADLVWVIEQRNIFAHRVLSSDHPYVNRDRKEGIIRFLQLKNRVNNLDYDEKAVKLLLNVIIDLNLKFRERLKS